MEHFADTAAAGGAEFAETAEADVGRCDAELAACAVDVAGTAACEEETPSLDDASQVAASSSLVVEAVVVAWWP